MPHNKFHNNCSYQLHFNLLLKPCHIMSLSIFRGILLTRKFIEILNINMKQKCLNTRVWLEKLYFVMGTLKVV